METLVYILAVGLIATAFITFRVIDALAKEVVALKEKVNR
ncbi:MAG: Uncharacterised protein [Cryomorphaceae bacterium]|jgi:hypothetical protein|nr:MAG: Uncharacterised protein [Cryomorphaceae bacterium]